MKRSVVYSTLFALVYQGVWATGAFAAATASAVATKEPLMLSSTQGKTEHGLSPVRDNPAFEVDGDRFTYDALGRVTERAHYDKDGKLPLWHETYSYGSGSHMHGKVRNDGMKFDYSYAPDGQLLAQTWSQGGHQLGQIDWVYDNQTAKLDSVTQGGQTQHYTYYPGGYMLESKYPDGAKQSTQLDSFNRVVSQTNAAKESETYQYDKNNQLQVAQYRSDKLTNFYSDADTMVNNKIGILDRSQLGKQMQSFDYNGFGDVSATHTVEDNTDLLNLYGYDAQGRLAQVSKTSKSNNSANLNLTQRYQYDSLNQLTEEKAIPSGIQAVNLSKTDYQYDGNGNVTLRTLDGQSTAIAYNALDQRNADTYDENGRLVRDQQNNTYTYNSLDQLLNEKDASGQLLASYQYYPDGLMRTRTSGDQTQHFYYQDGKVNVVKTQKTGSPDETTTDFMLFGGHPLVAYTSDADNTPIYYLRSNHSTGATLNNNQLSGYNYSAYGENLPLSKTPPASQSIIDQADKSFTWDQEYRDPKTQMTYLRARFYKPQIMSFMSMDNALVDNKYNFGNADPINNIDPSGHMSKSAETILNIFTFAFLAASTAAIVILSGGSGTAVAGEVDNSAELGVAKLTTTTTFTLVGLQAGVLGARDIAEKQYAMIGVDALIVLSGTLAAFGKNPELFIKEEADQAAFGAKMMKYSMMTGGVAYGLNTGINSGSAGRGLVDAAVAGAVGWFIGGPMYTGTQNYLDGLNMLNKETNLIVNTSSRMARFMAGAEASLGKWTKPMIVGFGRSLAGNVVGMYATHMVDSVMGHGMTLNSFVSSFMQGTADLFYGSAQGALGGSVSYSKNNALMMSWSNIKAPVQMYTQGPMDDAFKKMAG